MRLVNTTTRKLHTFDDPSCLPPYTILSHCWEADEVVFSDLSDLDSAHHKAGFQKLQGACHVARTLGMQWLWADTVCIDRSSSAELSQAINSMFQWYRGSQVCLVYLNDLHHDQGAPADIESRLRDCRWMRRSWTLQELIAPKMLLFYDSEWTQVGTKASLINVLSGITRVDRAVLHDAECLSDFSIGRRMSWAAHRKAFHVEDIAYALIGLFKVSMTIIYGEGLRAFFRLQEEILKDTEDASLFAWQSVSRQQYRGLFASSPSEFGHFADLPTTTSLQIEGNVYVRSAGVAIEATFGIHGDGQDVLLSLSSGTMSGDRSTYLGILFRNWNGRFVRSLPHLTLSLSEMPKGTTRTIQVKRDVDSRTSDIIDQFFRNHGPKSLDTEISWTTVSSDDKYHTAIPRDLSFIHGGTQEHNAVNCQSQRTASLKQLLYEGCKSSSASVNEPYAPILYNETLECEDSSDDDAYLFTAFPPEHPRLHANHEYSRVKDELAESALTEFSVSVLTGEVGQTTHGSLAMPCVQSQKGEQDRYPLFDPLEPSSQCTSKRVTDITVSRTSKRLKSTLDTYIEVEQFTDSEDEETIVVGHRQLKTPLAWACPYYVQNPQLHQTCLTRAHLRDVNDVKQHLWAAHRRPYFCPICREVFATAGACDHHVRDRSCTLRTSPDIEGISQYHMQQLARRPDAASSADDRWFTIWDIVFPWKARPAQAHLSGHVESVVCALRDYWARNGRWVVAEFLEAKSLKEEDDDRDEEHDLAALNAAVLEQMIDVVVARFRKDES